MQPGRTRYRIMLAPLVLVGALASSTVFADDEIKGVVTGRGGPNGVPVQTDSGSVIVAMSDTTKVHRMDGIRPVRVASSDLIPGLRIKAKGKFESPSTFVAARVTFSKADFRTASAIQAGVMPTDQRSLQNAANIERHSGQLAGHDAALGQHSQQLATQKGLIDANGQQIVATTGAVAATNARINNLDDFKTIKSITVYFANGKAVVSKDAKAQLQQFASDAQHVSGYMISVAAHASDVGSDLFNQKLSMERATAVTAILQQAGVPPGNVVVPAAMGVSQQVASNKSSKGQAENRRAVVTLLQNKGISGQ